MNDIDFINKSIEGQQFLSDEDLSARYEEIRNCDHTLQIINRGAHDVLGCPKCGWWEHLRQGETPPKTMMDKYGIVDKRNNRED